MRLAVLSSIITFLFTSLSWAQSDLTVPDNLEAYLSGYPQAPVIQCPRPKKKYEDMLSQLNGIKQKIRGEACPQGKIDAIKSEVESLETILTDGRKNFIELIKKGTVGGGQLSPEEITGLQDYIDDVVKKTASVTGLVNNPACFDEGEKVSTLSFLSSLIGDVSGAIGALAGPFGAKISLGGKLAAGLLGSIDTIVQARKTYNYDKYEDRKNYLHNLCAYYQFKGDFDKESKVFDYIDQLYGVKESAEQLLDQLSSSCAECQEVIEDYLRRVGGGSSASIERFQVAPYKSRRTADLTFQELQQLYFPETSFRNVHPELTGNFDQGSLTLTALQAKAWAESEIQKVQDIDEAGLTDEGRREVMRVQKQIESFLVDREGSRYISYYRGVVRNDLSQLQRAANTISYSMRQLKPVPDQSFSYQKGRAPLANVFHDVFRSGVTFQAVKDGHVKKQVAEQIVKDAKGQLRRLMQTVRVDFSILQQRCLFFEKSNFDFTVPMKRQCSSADRQLNDIRKVISDIGKTSFAKRYGSFLDFVDNLDKQWTADWMASLTQVLRQQAQ